MARGMCCVVLSMYEPSADSSSMGCPSHMADHMTPSPPEEACLVAGEQRRRPPTWIPKHGHLWGHYPNPPLEQHSLFEVYSGVKTLNVYNI